MLRTRVIPCLQLINGSLVKTVKFKNHSYIGDPVNTVRIFNELEVDELCFLDIRASVENREPDYELLGQIAEECFMPLAYGGGIRTIEAAHRILSTGFEKIIVNTEAYRNPQFVRDLTARFGSQAVIGSIDVKKNIWGKRQVYIYDGTKKVEVNPVEWARALVEYGAGELFVTSMDKEGTWEGYDLELIKEISQHVSVPVIANGGAGSMNDMHQAVFEGKASAVALSSFVVYQKKGMGVLVNFPDKESLYVFNQG
ncbi:AglZ/HisF2 family acetamidino modification protein [Polluticoccus soli]|uniref:AglZ/HisF2 family acetamidino modification protein n=1 Tax=Polluticoccus soli TaxID=3034150 RepID=UPI0023E10A82|nr:AglZ/HisF2 family acetamidino modification protein [Flavipsychrobacter sp. JY13-12]